MLSTKAYYYADTWKEKHWVIVHGIDIPGIVSLALTIYCVPLRLHRPYDAWVNIIRKSWFNIYHHAQTWNEIHEVIVHGMDIPYTIASCYYLIEKCTVFWA